MLSLHRLREVWHDLSEETFKLKYDGLLSQSDLSLCQEEGDQFGRGIPTGFLGRCLSLTPKLPDFVSRLADGASGFDEMWESEKPKPSDERQEIEPSACKTPSLCAKLLAMSAQSIKQHVDMNGYAIIPACVSEETIGALAQTLDDREHGVRNLLTNRDVRDSLPSIQPF